MARFELCARVLKVNLREKVVYTTLGVGDTRYDAVTFLSYPEAFALWQTIPDPSETVTIVSVFGEMRENKPDYRKFYTASFIVEMARIVKLVPSEDFYDGFANRSEDTRLERS